MITLTKLDCVEEAIKTTNAKYLISLLSPHQMIPTPDGILSENHLKLEMDDISIPIVRMICPDSEHVRSLLNFGKTIEDDASVVVHCQMGMSRSAAALITLLVQRNPGREEDVVDLVYGKALHIVPNRLIINLADYELGCRGRLARAVEEMPKPLDYSFDGLVSFRWRF